MKIAGIRGDYIQQTPQAKPVRIQQPGADDGIEDADDGAEKDAGRVVRKILCDGLAPLRRLAFCGWRRVGQHAGIMRQERGRRQQANTAHFFFDQVVKPELTGRIECTRFLSESKFFGKVLS